LIPSLARSKKGTDVKPPRRRYGSWPYYSYCLRRHGVARVSGNMLPAGETDIAYQRCFLKQKKAF